MGSIEASTLEVAARNVNGAGAHQAVDVEHTLRHVEAAARIANQNLAHQSAVQMQQALFQVQLAAVGKCTEMILRIDASAPDAKEQLASCKSIMDMLTEHFDTMIAKLRI